MIVTINGRDIELGDKERLNVVQAAQRAGVEIPHYCWHPALSVVASCRMCLVEVGEKKPDGTASIPPGCLRDRAAPSHRSRGPACKAGSNYAIPLPSPSHAAPASIRPHLGQTAETRQGDQAELPFSSARSV